jgi:hypothetical protein
MDLTKSIEPKSDQMNAEDLLSGPRTFTITEVREGNAEQPVWVYFAEFDPGKPFKPSKTVRKLMVLAWGPDSDVMIGQRMTLFCDDTVKWAGKPVGGIRVSHMSGMKKKLAANLSETKGKRVTHVVELLADAPVRHQAPEADPLDALVAAFDARGITYPVDRLAYCSEVTKRPLGSARDMTPAEVAAVVADLQNPADR